MSRLGPFQENIIVCGDAIEVMAQLPDACVDAVVTDPPYGLEFMGKEWDGLKGWRTVENMGERTGDFGGYSKRKTPRFDTQATNELMQAYQSWTTAWATEAYRILKPGGYLIAMGGTRTHHRLGCGLEDAGFEIRDCLAWIYATGFPKNYDVSKGIDKKAGAEREVVGSRGLHGWDSKKGSLRDHYGEYEGDFEKADLLTAATTPEAQYWEGYGTSLKPAHEPIWLCKKPNEGTYVDNVLEHGCGAMNIDGCRVEYQSKQDFEEADRNYGTGSMHFGQTEHEPEDQYRIMKPGQGRWPANVLVDCYPEEFQGGVVIEGEAQLHHGGLIRASKSIGNGNIYRGGGPGLRREPDESLMGNGLLGPYTRFFVIPKPSKREKNKGCMELYYRREKGGHVRIEREGWNELIKEEEHIKEKTGKRKTLQARGNIHVTVKPVRLGIWLIKLITPHQHPVIVLDNFCGSGSFLVSGLRLNQEQGYQIEVWGIDKDKDSVETARARVEAEKDRAGRQLKLL